MANPEKVSAENPLHLSWHDSAWIPLLNRGNVLKYFSERSNSFYDSQCNNEIIKMQGLSLDHLTNMTGIEYTLLHCQEPILYIIRKQMRHSPTHVVSIADYYIIAGIVYQAPDIKSVVNSRLTSSLHHLDSAFSEAISYSRYHPSKGYWWQFNDDNKTEGKEKKTKKKKEEPGSLFQCRRVDQLLDNLTSKFPHKFYQVQPGGQPVPLQKDTSENADAKAERVNQQTSADATAKATTGTSNTPGSITVKSSQSPAPSATQLRVKSEMSENMKQPFEKRTKYV
uniref:mediator of RNA polymerase II transcription subunit 6-like n=1 Tax=Styela clava TaxID=7725 RepID=UPI0019398E47|nr:mediator of RNA polymerase II transcription subunit 6-like [Styela clava]